MRAPDLLRCHTRRTVAALRPEHRKAAETFGLARTQPLWVGKDELWPAAENLRQVAVQAIETRSVAQHHQTRSAVAASGTVPTVRHAPQYGRAALEMVIGQNEVGRLVAAVLVEPYARTEQIRPGKTGARRQP